MATYLYRLGRFAFRRRWLVLGLWLAFLAATLIGAATLSGKTTDAFRIPGTPSQQAIDLLQQRFPQASAGGATARVVFAAPDGQQLASAANKAAVERVVEQLKQAPQVASVKDPFESRALNQTGTVGFAQATYQVPAQEMSPQARAALISIVDQARTSGLTVEAGGDALDTNTKQSLAEVIGVAVAAVVLVITFGSLVAAGLPLLTALLGVGIGIGAISALTGFVDLSSTTPVLALMLGLAVAIDYALFIVSRYRHELAVGREPEEAVGRAVGTAGSAVVFAGLTVVIALAALSVVGVPFLTQMGLGAAGTVAVAVIIALTLLPALLGFAGHRVLGTRRTVPHEEDSATNFGTRWARGIARRPVLALLVAVLGLGVVAVPAMDLQLGMPDDSTAAPDTTQRKAYDLIAAGFGPGFNGPLTVVVDTAAGTAKDAGDQVAQKITGLDDVAAVIPAATNPAGDTAVLTVIPTSGPSDTATEDLVHAIRQLDGTVPGADIGVTGLTAVNIDVSTKLGDSLIPYLAVVVGLAFVLLMLVFRSMLVPLKATLGFLLTIVATFGAVVAVFQWGWAARPARRGADRADHQLPAHHPDRHRVRPGHGLPGLPGHPDARGLRARRGRQAGRRRRRRPRRPGRHRGRDHHDQRLRRVHPLPRRHHQVDRLRAGPRGVLRRLHRPDDDRAGRHDAAGQGRLVAAPLAGPAAAQCRRRRREAASPVRRRPGGAGLDPGLSRAGARLTSSPGIACVRSSAVPRRRKAPLAVEPSDDSLVMLDGRMLFVAGYTSGGAPYGVFIDEPSVEDLQGDPSCGWELPGLRTASP